MKNDNGQINKKLIDVLGKGLTILSKDKGLLERQANSLKSNNLDELEKATKEKLPNMGESLKNDIEVLQLVNSLETDEIKKKETNALILRMQIILEMIVK